MKRVTLPHSSLEVSTICLGTMTFGQQNSESEAWQQLDYAAERGINFIDTAEMYPVPPRAESCHRTESFIGPWLKRQQRDQWVVATKAAGGGRGMKWIRKGDLAFKQKNLQQAVDNSLIRLQTDYIDLYQLHWPERNTPMFGEYRFNPDVEREYTNFLESLEALDGLIKKGKIRHIGLSNEWPWGVMKFLQTAKDHGLPRVISVQNAYNLLNRSYETAMLECCYREEVALLAYSPLAFGILSGKYHEDSNAEGRVNLFKGFAQRYQKPMVQKAVAAYIELANDHGLTPTQLALSFVYSRWFVASTIIGATTMPQLKENIDAHLLEPSDTLISDIESIHLHYFFPAP